MSTHFIGDDCPGGHEDDQCRKTTLRGGAGVDDASGVGTYRCVDVRGHTGPCRYREYVGEPEMRS